VPGTLTVKNLLPTQLVKGSILNSPTRLFALARKTKWLVRQPKKLLPVHFVHGILHAVIKGERSFRLLASSIGMRLDEKAGSAGSGEKFDTISKPALWARIGPEAVALFREILADMLKNKVWPDSDLPALPGITRIIVQDSSKLNFDARHSDSCPGSSNQHTSGAGMTLQAAFDLVSGKALILNLTKYRRTDQKAAFDIIPQLRPGDLLLRDLGYHSYQAFLSITGSGAHYISRLLGKSVLHHTTEAGGGRIDLLAMLRKNAPSPGDTIDIDVVIGSGQQDSARIASRLVARRVPRAVEEKRLRRLGQDEKRLNKKYSKVHRRLLGWQFYITSLPREAVSAEKIFELYQLRWRIEVIFKAAKSHTALEQIAAHQSNINHVQTMLHAWLCALVLATETRAFALAIEGADGLRANCMSLLKVMAKVFDLLSASMLAGCAPAVEIMGRWSRQMGYHDRYESRKTRTNMAEMAAKTLGLASDETSAPAAITTVESIA
jgi:hypothetical protein